MAHTPNMKNTPTLKNGKSKLPCGYSVATLLLLDYQEYQ